MCAQSGALVTTVSTFTVFVADTRHAKVYELGGPRLTMRAIETLENTFTGKHERDLGSDAPGHVLSRAGARGAGAGGRRTALQPRSTHKQHATRQFARQLAKRIAGAIATGDGVVLVAAPRFLAELQEHLSKSAKQHIVREVRRDLIDLPASELRRRVVEALRAD